jgi:RNA polymerase sigma-70 factor, ECF subfamily
MSTPWPLAAIFAATSTGADSGAELERRLSAALAAGRAKWPDIAIEPTAFTRYLAERVPAGRLDQACCADLYLACACATGDAGAIDAFDARYLSGLASVLGKTGMAADVADEAVQIVRARLFVADGDRGAQIAGYAGRGPIEGWLRVAAVRVASRRRRGEARRDALARAAAPEAGIAAVDPELATIRRRYGPLSAEALRGAFACLTAEERTVLRLHFVDGLNLEQTGAVLGLSRATVGRRLIAARERLLE